MKIYIVFTGKWDEKIEFITQDLEKAYSYIDNECTEKWCDLREYEINKHQFTRP